jgi:hypothetical protein
MRDYGPGHGGVGFAALGCAEKAGFCNRAAGCEAALQHGHDVVWAGIANPCLYFAQEDARDADGSSHPATQQIRDNP